MKMCNGVMIDNINVYVTNNGSNRNNMAVIAGKQ